MAVCTGCHLAEALPGKELCFTCSPEYPRGSFCSTGPQRHCCDIMAREVDHRCEQHDDPSDCPDALIHYSADHRRYGLRIHDGGSSYLVIAHCPWCGKELAGGRDAGERMIDV